MSRNLFLPTESWLLPIFTGGSRGVVYRDERKEGVNFMYMRRNLVGGRGCSFTRIAGAKY